MAENNDNSTQKLVGLNQIDRLAQSLNAIHEKDFGDMVTLMEQLDKIKADKETLQRVEEMFGGKSLRYLTQEEYDALSDEEKEDETIVYNITDGETSDGITEEDLFKLLPCYDTRENIVKEYTYDGIVGEREYLTHFVKISNDIYTLEDIKNFYDVVIEISSGDRIIDNLSLPFIPVNEQVLIENKLLFLEVLFVAFEDCELEGLSFTKGIWFLSEDDRNAYVSRFKFIISGEGEFKQLDKKFMTIKPGENVEGQVMIVRIDDEEVIETTAEVGAEIFNITGGRNVAVGQFSHAEGYSAQAIGEISHSEGFYTTATGNYSHVEGYETTAVGVSSHAEGEGTRALGNTTHSEGCNTEAEGNYSHAEGNNTHTKGEASHAEGYDTYAIGEFSHVEGAFNYANKSCSHAEGSNSKADGVASHVEGFSNEAIGNYSHAEGYDTKAEGIGSHSEGSGTEAKGNYSHSEGFMTIAMNDCQHVQGKLNISDEENKYAHIVGNGQEHTDDNISFTYTYSNAHTLDWDGNAWFAGDVTIGADNKKLATEEYVDSKGGANIDINAAASDKLNTQDKTIIGAINELELESFETKAELIALDEYKLEQEDLPCYDTRDIETYTFSIPADDDLSEYEVKTQTMDITSGSVTIQLIKVLDLVEFIGVEGEVEMIYESNHGENSYSEYNTIYFQEVREDAVNPNVYIPDNAYLFIVTEDNSTVQINEMEIPPFEGVSKGVWIFKLVEDVVMGSTTLFMCAAYTSGTIRFIKSGELTRLDEKYISHKPGKCIKKGTEFIVDNETKIADYGAEIFNYPDNIATGNYSHAEGLKTIATGSYSHAEGQNTKATGSYSHAEGQETKAFGNGSHAEGASTEASGYSSHAEGTSTKASGQSSHAEGYDTKAEGVGSHSEGVKTIASGQSSHAEGYCTISASKYQHVQGKYNIEDSADAYQHIVGNGTESNPSNAYTLDWSGNAWFAGKATVSVQPTDNNDLTTKLYVDQSIAQANETQTSLITQNMNESLDKKQDKVYVDISSEVDKTERSYINNITSSKVLTPNTDNYLILNTSINLIPYKTYCMYFTYDIEGSMNSIRGRSHTAALINEDDITYIGEDSIILYDNCTYTDGKLVENNGTSVLFINEMSRNYTLTAFSIALGGYELLNDDFFLTHRFVTDADNFASQDYVDNAIAELREEMVTLEEDDLTIDGLIDGTFPSLTTEDKTLIGAINELKTNKADNIELFSGSYNDLTDKPEIPSINGLATEGYVDGAILGISNNLQGQIDELFQNVSNGKELIASAITDKGVDASEEETFQSLSEKINLIPSGPPGSNIIGYINEENEIYVSLTELESGTYTLKFEDYAGLLNEFDDIGTVEV